MSYTPVNYHYEALGRTAGELMTKVRAPVLNILDCIWVSPKNHYGRPNEVERSNILCAGLDPVALDYWGGKHILYPIDRNPELNPDLFPEFGNYLKQAKETINAYGGILGRRVTFGEDSVELVTNEGVIDDILEAQKEGKVSASFASKMRRRLEAGM
jgi:hypothetical protein